MKKLLLRLLALPLLAAPAFPGVTIRYDVFQSIGPAGNAIQTRHTHSYTRSAMRADVVMQGPIQLDIADAIIRAKQPYLVMKLGSDSPQRNNIHDYEDAALPDAAVTPLGKTKTIIGCNTQGYKFKSARISGTFWICRNRKWADAYKFTNTLLKTLDAGSDEFGLYSRLLKILPKNGVVFEAEAVKGKKTLFHAVAVSAEKEKHPAHLFDRMDGKPIPAGEKDTPPPGSAKDTGTNPDF
ncbi:MAG: hypothetical protein PHW69_01645 [Elusimicrobiaceae bacterium]|nr:hypothetical protein [Elusimicrobiaceae bacterium]